MKVIFTMAENDERRETQYLDITEDQLKFFNWLKSNYDNEYLWELYIEKVEEINFKSI